MKCGAPVRNSVQLVNKTTNSSGFMVVIAIGGWGCKPIHNIWAPHIVVRAMVDYDASSLVIMGDTMFFLYTGISDSRYEAKWDDSLGL